MRNIGFALLLLLLYSPCYAQVYNRIEASVSIKTKLPDGKGSLEMGRIYFDKKNKKLVYDFIFPEKSTIVISDTTLYAIKDGKLVNQLSSYTILQSSIFHIILSGELSNYGLRSNSLYKVKSVEKDKELVVTTWEFTGKKNALLGNILVSTKNNQLFGVVVTNAEGKIISKQFFDQYTVVKGLKFPTIITQIIYQNEGNITQVTSFKNIIVNNLQNEKFYNYSIPY
jgi:hypothetical protein